MAGLQIPQACGLTQLPSTTVSGVYFLWHGDRIVYVGQSRHITQRVFQHIQDGAKVFDAMSWIGVEIRRLNAVEAYFIHKLVPPYNRCGLSEKTRRERPWGIDAPPPRMTMNKEEAADYLGLTVPQLQAIRKGRRPRLFRIPRTNARAYRADNLWVWKRDNADLIERARIGPR